MAIKKTDFSAIKKKYSQEASFKPDRFFDLGDAWVEACGIPGPAMGHINMFLGHSDTGKSQPLNSKVLTPNGWIKMGELKLGDEIIGKDGHKQYVIGIYPQGKRPVYEVTTNDGGITYCDIDHLWAVNTYKDRTKRKRDKNGIKRYSPDNTFKVMSLRDIISRNEEKTFGQRNFKIPIIDPVKYEGNSVLPIDPYVLGCILGDGYIGKNGDIVRISTKDDDIVENISKTSHFRKVSNIIREVDTATRTIQSISITKETKKILYDLGLSGSTSSTKFIPKIYLFGTTIEDRLKLLHGLMDTDGHCNRYGNAEFCTSSEKLKDDVIELVRSLGGITQLTFKIPNYKYKGVNKKGKKSYLLRIRLPKLFNPFSIERKSSKLNLNRINISRYITNIRYIGDEECQCIKVSNNDCLYITDDYIVTHNTTALIKTAIDAQKKGILPVLLITEQKWGFEHARLMGLDCENKIDPKTGMSSWEGFFIFRNDFKYIEQITDFINDLLNDQAKGELDYDLCFLWDSVGSVPCKMTYEGKGGKQHNASVLSDKIGMGINQRITGSRRSDEKHTNTLVICNQPWVELPDNPMGQPRIKAKGGESMWLNSSLVFLFGNQKNAGITKISIKMKVNDYSRQVKIAVRTKISVLKNHINGLGYEDGKIMITAHDFMKARTEAEEKKSIDEYTRTSTEYICKMLEISPSELKNTDIIEEDIDA